MFSRETLITLKSIASEAATRGEKAKNFVKKKKEEQANVTAKEAMAFSILYNNIFFLLSTVVLAFYIFGSVPAV